jgi:LacI family transcriptional regulator
MLDYVPDVAARALRNSQTGLLGFALHHVNDPIYAEMVECAQAEATKRGYSIILMDTGELAERREHFRTIVQAHRVDGLLIQSGFGRGEEPLREIARSIPSVAFGGAVGGIRTVRLDDGAAARIATEHLLQSGHTAIAFVGADGVSSTRRYDGYLKALAVAGLPALPSIDGGWTSDEAHVATLRLLASGMPVTGIVVVTTTTALGVHSGIVAAGRRIPDDVSLVSVHDAWFARHLNPPLTVVSLPMGRAGTVGVSMLIEQIHGSAAGEVVVTDPAPALIVRGSTTTRAPEVRSGSRTGRGSQREGHR